MGILKKISSTLGFSKKSVGGGFVLGTTPALGSFLLLGAQGAAFTAASSLILYDQSSAVSIPVNRIATAIADMNMVLQLEDGTIESDSPVLDFLRKPSPYLTKNLFLETIAKNYLITGEYQVVAIGSLNFPPKELQPISPAEITVPQGNNGLPSSIEVAGVTLAGQYLPRVRGNSVRYIRDSLTELHMTRNFSTRLNSLLRGQSLLVSASKEVRQNILGGQHNVSLLEKGGNVSVVFNFKQSMSDEDFQATKQYVRQQFGGAENAGSIGVIAGNELEIQNIGSPNKDMDFFNLQQMARVAIANQYGFPLVFLDNSAATFNNYEKAKEALYDDAALPFAKVIMKGLSDFLLPRFGIDPCSTTIVPDMDSIPALNMRRNSELKIRKEIGIESINELRDFLPNRDDVDGGDKIYIPANLISIGSTPEDELFNDTFID
jgi:HK97 family phage portal protein